MRVYLDPGTTEDHKLSATALSTIDLFNSYHRHISLDTLSKNEYEQFESLLNNNSILLRPPHTLLNEYLSSWFVNWTTTMQLSSIEKTIEDLDYYVVITDIFSFSDSFVGVDVAMVNPAYIQAAINSFQRNKIIDSFLLDNP